MFAPGEFRDIVPESRRLGIKVLVACQDDRVFRAQIEEFTSWFTFIEYMPTASAFPVFGAQPVVFDGVGGLEMVNQRRMKAMRLGKSVLDFLLSLVAFVFFLPTDLVVTFVKKAGSVEYCTSIPLICLSSALVFLFFLIFFQETVTLPFLRAFAFTLAGTFAIVTTSAGASTVVAGAGF